MIKVEIEEGSVIATNGTVVIKESIENIGRMLFERNLPKKPVINQLRESEITFLHHNLLPSVNACPERQVRFHIHHGGVGDTLWLVGDDGELTEWAPSCVECNCF